MKLLTCILCGGLPPGAGPRPPEKFHPMKLLAYFEAILGLILASVCLQNSSFNRSVFSSYLSLRRRALKLIFKQFWVSFWPRFASKIGHFGVLGAPWGPPWPLDAWSAPFWLHLGLHLGCLGASIFDVFLINFSTHFLMHFLMHFGCHSGLPFGSIFGPKIHQKFNRFFNAFLMHFGFHSGPHFGSIFAPKIHQKI